MTVRETVRSLVSEQATLPADDAAPLELDSLAVVTLVEALEDRFGIRVAPREVTGEHFGTVDRIVAFVEGKT